MKVFCVGSNKTGITSLTSAMRELGFNPITTDKSYGLYFGTGLRELSREALEKLFHTFQLREYTFDFFVDSPFNLSGSHDILYEMFPDSLFILTIRDPENWFNSVLRWIQLRNAQKMYDWIWKTEVTEQNKTEVLNRYNRRNADITDFFKDKTNFLPLHTDGKYNFKKLSVFLNKDVIDKPYPHENRNIKQNSYVLSSLK